MTKNSMHLCLLILSRPMARRVMIAMRMTVEPVETEHYKTIKCMKAQAGAVEYMRELARKDFLDYAAEIFNILQSKDNLAELEFCVGAPEDDCHPDFVDDQKMAKVVADLARSVFRHEVLTMMSYSPRPPWVFAGLTDEDEATRRRALECCEELTEALYKLEKLAEQDFLRTRCV